MIYAIISAPVHPPVSVMEWFPG